SVEEGPHEGGLHDATAVQHMVERVAQDARGPVRHPAAAEGELPPQLDQCGVREQEGSRRDARVQGGVAEHALQLPALDCDRGSERHRAMPYEDRTDRAARDGRREEELAILQMKLDDVASQRDIANRRDTLALRLHL